MPPTEAARSAERPPSLLLLLAEGQRAVFERMTLPSAAPLLRRAPRGDGHPVLVLPGFPATDASTRVLRRYLGRLGYGAHPWLLGRNLGPRAGVHEGLVRRVAELQQRYQRPLSIVGWSLGGIYARELAKAMPRSVRQVVTLGSPFAGAGRPSNTSRLFDWFPGTGTRPPDALAAHLRKPPPVPSSALFSRTDGVVHWRSCLEPDAEHTENIEVPGSHCGLGFNPLVLYAVADRLSQPEGAWRPFHRNGWRRHVYG